MNHEIDRVPLERSVIHLLHRAGQYAGDIFHTINSLSELTPRQFAVLMTVSQNEGSSQTELVRLTGIDRSTLADIVRRMLSKEFLVRRRTKRDARAYAVELTEKGWSVLKTAEPAAQQVDQLILTALPPEKKEEFLASLKKLVETMNDSRSS